MASVKVFDVVFMRAVVKAAIPEIWLRGTILMRDPLDETFVPWDGATPAVGLGVISCDLEFTAAGNKSTRIIASGRVKSPRLVIHGLTDPLTGIQEDLLRVYNITPHAITDLSSVREVA